MNYCHTHDTSETLRKVSRSFLFAIFANLGFSLIEAIVALFAHSSSLLADAGHNVADVIGLAFGWGATYLQMRRPTDRFSYGYKRSSILAAFLNALILIATAAMIAIHSFEHLLHSHAVEEKWVVIIAGLGIIVNLGTALLFRHNHADINVKTAFLHLASDALISIGVVLTAIMIYYTHWYYIDPVVGLIITIVMMIGTWNVCKRSIDLILDAVPDPVNIQDVYNFLKAWPDVTGVHDLHIWGLSTTEVALTAHLIVPKRYLDDNELLSLAQTLSKDFGIGHVTIQVERGTMNLASEIKLL